MIKKFLFDLSGFANYRELWLNRLIVLLAFVLPFSEGFAKKILAVIFLLWLSTLNKEKIFNTLKERPIIYFGILTLAMLLSVVYTTEYSYNLTLFNRFVIYILLPMMIISSSVRKDYIMIVISGFLFSMFISEVISYGILFDFWLELKHGYPVYFMPHVFYGVLLSFTILIMTYHATRIQNKLYKMVIIFFILTMIGNLVISGARTGQIILVLSFILTNLLFYKIKMRLILKIVLLPIIISSIAYNVYPKFKVRADRIIIDIEQVVEKQNYNTPLGTRIGGYVLTYKMIQSNTIFENLFGHGAGDIHKEKAEASKKYFGGKMFEQEYFSQFHSSYMDVFGWLGLVGLVLTVLFLYSIYRIKIEDEFLRYIKLSLFFVLVFAYFPDSGLDSQYVMLLTSIFIGLLLVQQRLEREEITPIIESDNSINNRAKD